MFPHSPPISATLVPQYPKLCRGWFVLTLSGPPFLYNFEDQGGVESSTTCSCYFSACIKDRKFWTDNPKN